jgi:hypothetical protein
MQQFIGVGGCPFHGQSQGSRGKTPIYHRQGSYFDDSRVISILCVEMRRVMVVPEHLDDDSVKSTDFRHI